MKFTRKGRATPVVLPHNKGHSCASFATLNSEEEGSTKASISGAKPSPAELAVEDEGMFKELLDSYSCENLLGKGSSAQVFEVIHRRTGMRFACKVVRKGQAINDDSTMTMESEIMKRSDHTNVIGLHELYETRSSKWYILEMATAGTLQRALALRENYSEQLVAESFRQVLCGVQYLHDMGIVHRDLKQDNILCSIQDIGGEAQLVPKITDFGLSTVIDVPSSSQRRKSYNKLKQIWGTKENFAPEVYNQAYGPQADVWALGCVLYELLTGDAPFPVREKPTSVVEKYLFNGGNRVRRSFEMRPAWHALSAEARDLVSRMLKVNPRKRLSVAESLDHPFITGGLLPQEDERTDPLPGQRNRVLAEAREKAQKRARTSAQHRKNLASILEPELKSLIMRATSQ
jgi:serine/threonine protein kinase